METNDEKAGKFEAKFNQAIHRLASVVGGHKKLFPSKKVAADEIDDLVLELFEEDRKKNIAEAKQALKDLLEKYAAFHKEVRAKKQELEKLKDTKMEEFVKAAHSLFEKFDGINEREASYYAGLKHATQESNSTEEDIPKTEE